MGDGGPRFQVSGYSCITREMLESFESYFPSLSKADRSTILVSSFEFYFCELEIRDWLSFFFVCTRADDRVVNDTGVTIYGQVYFWID